MTFFATREGDSKHIDVHVTHGPISIVVSEDPGHLRYFHTELGHLLDQVEGKPQMSAQPIGYQGAAQHTFTAACDGFHEPGQCPAHIEVHGG